MLLFDKIDLMKSFWNTINAIYEHTLLGSTVIILLLTSLFGTFISNSSQETARAADPTRVLYADRVVERGYRTLLNRSPDGNGRKYWNEKVYANPNAQWFAKSVMNLKEYKNGSLNALNNEAFIDQMFIRSLKREAFPDEMRFWGSKLSQSTSNRAELAGFVIENGFSFVLTKPTAHASQLHQVKLVDCKGFKLTGIKPLCYENTSGTTRNVATKKVAGSNITVNQAWHHRIVSLRDAADKAGYNLQAYQDPKAPAGAGSYRTYETQVWLYNNGFPAAKPGTSMHEWGMAIDFTCNGMKLGSHKNCLKWLKQNAARFGVYNLPNEPWHWSSNGR